MASAPALPAGTPAAGREKHGAMANKKNITPKSEQELQSLFEESSKLFSEGKITTKNAYDVRILDYLKPMLELKLGNRDLNYHAASQVIDMAARTWAMRVQVLYSSALNSQSLLSRAMKANDMKGAAAAGLDKNKRRALTVRKTVLVDDSKITVRSCDSAKLDDADPLFVRIARLFETRGCEGKLLHQLEFNAEGSLLLPGHPRAPFEASTTRRSAPTFDPPSFHRMPDDDPSSLPPPMAVDATHAEPAAIDILPRVPHPHRDAGMVVDVADIPPPREGGVEGEERLNTGDGEGSTSGGQPPTHGAADAALQDDTWEALDFGMEAGVGDDVGGGGDASQSSDPKGSEKRHSRCSGAVHDDEEVGACIEALRHEVMREAVFDNDAEDDDRDSKHEGVGGALNSQMVDAVEAVPARMRAKLQERLAEARAGGDYDAVGVLAASFELLKGQWSADTLGEGGDTSSSEASSAGSDSEGGGSDVSEGVVAPPGRKAQMLVVATSGARSARRARSTVRRAVLNESALADACTALSASLKGANDRKRAREGGAPVTSTDLVAAAQAAADPSLRTLKRYKLISSMLRDRSSSAISAAQLDEVAALSGHTGVPEALSFAFHTRAAAVALGQRQRALGDDESCASSEGASDEERSHYDAAPAQLADDAPPLVLGDDVDMSFGDALDGGDGGGYQPWDAEEVQAVPQLQLPAELAHDVAADEVIEPTLEGVGGGVVRRAPAMVNVEEYRVNYCKRVKNVDVGRLKKRIWARIVKGGTVAAASVAGGVQQAPEDAINWRKDSSKVPADVPRYVHAATQQLFVCTLEDVIVEVVRGGVAGIAADVKDVSPSLCMLCLLHLANDYDLNVWSDDASNVFVGCVGEVV